MATNPSSVAATSWMRTSAAPAGNRPTRVNFLRSPVNQSAGPTPAPVWSSPAST